jgi:uncharacterized membrane protein
VSSSLDREILQHRIQRAARRHLPAAAPDYFRMLVGAVVGFGIVALVLRRFTSVDPLWVLIGVALAYSLRSAYYKRKLAADPGYMLPKCGCGGMVNDRTEIVLRSTYSSMLGVSNAAAGAFLYVALFVSVLLHLRGVATGFAALAVVGSAYLGYVMVVRISALCPTCVTIAGLNLLILWQLLA